MCSKEIGAATHDQKVADVGELGDDVRLVDEAPPFLTDGSEAVGTSGCVDDVSGWFFRRHGVCSFFSWVQYPVNSTVRKSCSADGGLGAARRSRYSQ